MSRTRSWLATVAVLVGACSPDTTAPRPDPLASDPTARRTEAPFPSASDPYIVVLRDGVSPASVLNDHGASATFTYSAALNGFAAKLSPGQRQRLERDPRVKFVEADREVSAEAFGPDPGSEMGILSTQPGAPWGLDRIDQPNLPLNSEYRYTTTGTRVHAYLLSTGIRRTHNEFATSGGTRVAAVGGTSGYDAYGGSGADCNGSGTGDAGIVGGRTYGVAKNVRLHIVKVYDCGGATSTAVILGGVDWVTHNFTKPAVALLGLTSSGSAALSAALEQSVDYGVTWVATGGDVSDACPLPASAAQGVIVAGATDASDGTSGPTGTCVDIFAPGDNIPSAGAASNTSTITRNWGWAGAAHVAGLAALFLQANPNAGPGMVWDAIRSSARNGVVTGTLNGAPNRLARKWNHAFTAAGQSRFEPDGGSFATSTSGYIRGWLVGSPGTNYNLRLQKRDPVTLAWSTVASKTTASTKEVISYFGGAGTYRWVVESASGVGTYDLFVLHP